ncbi:MAG: hypothetical protein WCI55_11540 [Armatimonadota bacterium]
MTGKEFAAQMMDECGYQLKACLVGISDENFVATPLAGMMSIRDSLEHCAEAYVAVQKGIAGEKHSWGTYKFPAGSVNELVDIFDTERAKAVELSLEKFDDDSHFVKDYIVAHEFYHVGQMVSVRLALGDGFEPYSIYRF